MALKNVLCPEKFSDQLSVNVAAPSSVLSSELQKLGFRVNLSSFPELRLLHAWEGPGPGATSLEHAQLSVRCVTIRRVNIAIKGMTDIL